MTPLRGKVVRAVAATLMAIALAANVAAADDGRTDLGVPYDPALPAMPYDPGFPDVPYDPAFPDVPYDPGLLSVPYDPGLPSLVD